MVDVFPSLCDDHWGEQVRFFEDHSVELALTGAELSQEDAEAVWEPFFTWVARRPDDYDSDAFAASAPFEGFWDPQTWETLAPDMIRHDERPDQPRQRFWWTANQGEVSEYLHAYQSWWLPARLFTEAPEELTDSIF